MQSIISILAFLLCVAVFFGIGLAIAAFRYKMAKKYPNDESMALNAGCGCGRANPGDCAKGLPPETLQLKTEIGGKKCTIVAMTPPTGNARLRKYEFPK